MSHRLVSIGALLLALTAVGSAVADSGGPSVEEVKAAESDFNRGREAYKTGSYSEAAEYFESADAHAPNERVLELAIGARDKAAILDRAATDAQLALERYPNSERLRKIAAPLVDKARTDLLTVVVECDEPCSVLDGPRLIHGAPAARRMVFLTPESHTLRASWSEDRGETKEIAGKAGETVTVQFTAPPIPVKEEATAPVAPTTDGPGDQGVQEKPKPLKPLFFLIGAGATAVLGGVTVWSGIDTVNNPGASAVREKCVGLGESCPEYEKGRSAQLRTNILIGATSVVGVATGVIGVFFTDWSGKPKDETTAGVSPWVSFEGGAAVGATGRF